MISVAICDDNLNDLKVIKTIVEDLKKAFPLRIAHRYGEKCLLF